MLYFASQSSSSCIYANKKKRIPMHSEVGRTKKALMLTKHFRNNCKIKKN